MPSRLVALWCWYHGGAFRGYQSQPLGPTVQDTITSALRNAGFSRNPVPSGRTDLGVHARMQVLSLRVVEGVQPEEVATRLNTHLPRTVGVCLSRRVGARFNASWRATGKEYRYRLALADTARCVSPQGWGRAAWRVDVRPELLAEELARCVGTRNFWAFHDKSSSVRPRTVRAATVAEVEPGVVEVRLEGDGFARFMVRYLVGAAVGVARGELSQEHYLAALEHAAPFKGHKAPAQGLTLWEVRYPPGDDPFTAAERALAPGLPAGPPFGVG